MNEEIAALRHRAFAVKLALRRVAAFNNELKRARLSAQVPELEYFVAAPHLKVLFDEFQDVHTRVETSLFEEVVRLSLEAERSVNAYVKRHYGFAPVTTFKWGIRRLAARYVCEYTRSSCKAALTATSESTRASCNWMAAKEVAGTST